MVLFFVAAIILFSLIVLLVDSPYVDEFADNFSQYFELDDSKMVDTYLMEPGGLFDVPMFVPTFVAMTSYGLMWAQIPVQYEKYFS